MAVANGSYGLDRKEAAMLNVITLWRSTSAASVVAERLREYIWEEADVVLKEMTAQLTEGMRECGR